MFTHGCRGPSLRRSRVHISQARHPQLLTGTGPSVTLQYDIRYFLLARQKVSFHHEAFSLSFSTLVSSRISVSRIRDHQRRLLIQPNVSLCLCGDLLSCICLPYLALMHRSSPRKSFSKAHVFLYSYMPNPFPPKDVDWECPCV